jgi:hypothetical protein
MAEIMLGWIERLKGNPSGDWNANYNQARHEFAALLPLGLEDPRVTDAKGYR